MESVRQGLDAAIWSGYRQGLMLLEIAARQRPRKAFKTHRMELIGN
jgi:hypothetical protein